MKRGIIAVLALMVVLSGCGKAPASVETPVVEDKPVAEQVVPKEESVQAFFDAYVDTKVRPVAVMVDNDDENARPQAGLEDAYLIYEMVVEGGATRFMALFRNADTEKIGPVRSSRHYFLDYALENDVIYTHFGYSPKALEDIPALGVKNINGVEGSDSGIFWRDTTYTRDWHSAFTSMEKIMARAEQKKYAVETEHKNALNYASEYFTPVSETKAEKVTLAYSGRYKTGYAYDAEKEMYQKTIHGKAHKMQSGEVLEFKNIIVMLIGDSDLGDGSARRNIVTTGSGKGYYITNGVCEEITWSKSARSANTEYKKADGTPLEINPGKTIVNLINPAIGVVME